MSDKMMVDRAVLEAFLPIPVSASSERRICRTCGGMWLKPDQEEHKASCPVPALQAALAPASSERAAAGVLDLLPQWEAWRAKWWTRADEERSQYALGVTAALGDCLDDLRRVLDIPEDEPAPVRTAVKDGEG